MSKIDTKRDDFIKSNTGLVYACAKRFIKKGMEYEDIIQAGMIGLIKAYDRFDESLGFKFSTYAVPIILGEIKHIFRENSSVKVSRSLKDLSLKIGKVCQLFSFKNGRSPTVCEIAEVLNEDEEKIVQAIWATQNTVSLSGYLSSDGETVPFDIPIEENYNQITDRIDLRRAVLKLKKEDQILIDMRFFKNKTQTETAKVLGTTQVQVSRKEKKILASLKESLK